MSRGCLFQLGRRGCEGVVPAPKLGLHPTLGPIKGSRMGAQSDSGNGTHVNTICKSMSRSD